MKGGWITLPRRFFDGAAWRENRKLSRAEAMLDLYQRAQWDAGEVFIRGKLLPLARGEQVASCRFLAERWGWTKDTVARFLKTMESEASGNRYNFATPSGLLIRAEVRQGETVLILCNYDEWTLAGMSGCDGSAPGSETQLQAPERTPARQGRDKAKEGEEVKESIKEEETATTAREAEQLVAACPRPSPTREALQAALACIDRHAGTFTFDRILEATRNASALIREWPEDERLTYCPSAANFFKDDLWRRHPTDWQSRRDAKKRLATTNGKPVLTDAERRARIGGRA